jgi:hypothetical protein
MKTDFVVVSARALQATQARGPLENTTLPAGAIQAILYLADIDALNGPLQCTNAQGTVRSVAGPAGTLVLIDGRRAKCSWASAKKGKRQALEMVLLPRHRRLARSVIWPGMNNWPVDPFNFSIEGFVRHPSDQPVVQLAQSGDKWWQT